MKAALFSGAADQRPGKMLEINDIFTDLYENNG
jgi:hypothetical protein